MPTPTPYLDLATFKTLTVLRASDVDLVEVDQPGYTVAQIALEQSYLDARLRKRYAVPFAVPVPSIVQRWLAAIVTMAVWDRRGAGDSEQGSLARAKEAADRARAEITEAANSKDGLFDLPLNDATPGSNITQGSPLGYTETSPYVWTDQEAKQGSLEDSTGQGSTR